MSDLGMIMFSVTIAGPLIAMAWAMKPTRCPECGASIDPSEQHGVHTFVQK